MNFSENLKKIRKNNNLSQEQLADKLDVSRQSVSKWESGSAYPEMDKMLKICEIFKLGIDELLNQNIDDFDKEKENKNNFNNYMDDFLDFITKVINLFSSMKSKERLKCIMEQLINILVLVIVFSIINSIFSDIMARVLYLLPNNIHHIIYTIMETIYQIIVVILGVIILIHVFKVRYLNYYNIVEKEELHQNEELVDKQENKNSTISVESSPKEKIIIRDPDHSGYKVISSLAKCILFIIKLVVGFIALGFISSLIVFSICLVLSFLFVGTGLIFTGCVISLISIIVIHVIILIFLYNFIMNISNKKRVFGWILIGAFIVLGIGIGLIPIGVSKLDIVEDFNSKYFVTDTEYIPMNDNLFFHHTQEIEYVEENRNDIKIEKYHSKYYNVMAVNNVDGSVYIKVIPKKTEKEMFDIYLKDINNKKIVPYNDYTIVVYASKENIEKISNMNNN